MKTNFESLVKDCRKVEDRLNKLIHVLNEHEIDCEKYHHTIDGGPLLFDKYKA